ncbi:hypothetical protein P4493_05400 [Bacillus thuringiensis]|uniref:MarR family transcriptional regulator n=3 Tax=Bacillus thuringiensis TaxID=1428 RepID=A0A0B5NLC6_BACTU|nr:MULTISPECIES: hypothetical protein [Bacillus]MEC2534710.1 hypothetical protein [Bacillus cereus]MED1153568.1 hypothetical protein [Bacillus paranthracis]OUB09142.1 hypothetical protein BK708_31885 [Bacillus thuringiensis serovar yunnanensis]AFQ29896.1 hypothetical protein BTF1_28977 [Bacillus thuringiensis HD-789]AJG74157.1 hypothetical protein BF38_5683 [Bacillus thuringiensis]
MQDVIQFNRDKFEELRKVISSCSYEGGILGYLLSEMGLHNRVITSIEKITDELEAPLKQVREGLAMLCERGIVSIEGVNPKSLVFTINKDYAVRVYQTKRMKQMIKQ